MNFPNDGYTIVGNFESVGDLVYRPALRLERLDVLAVASRVADRVSVLRPAVARHTLNPVPSRVWQDSEVWLPIVSAVLGADTALQEQEDETNLREGVKLRYTYPHLEVVSCADCKKFVYSPLEGRFAPNEGPPWLRPEGDSLLCETREGCPKGTPDRQRVLSPKNDMALKFDLECRAVGQWPDDPIVRRNAKIIGDAFVEVGRGR